LELNFSQTFREIPDLVFSCSSNGSAIRVIYCLLDDAKWVWSSERVAVGSANRTDSLYQISSARFKES
jgi:hypothetical protein